MTERCKFGFPDTPDACYKGWIVARKLVDFDRKEKPFAFYPRKKHGKPPFWYKTKEEATRALEWHKKRDKLGILFSEDKPNVVVKFTKETYLDRW